MLLSEEDAIKLRTKYFIPTAFLTSSVDGFDNNLCSPYASLANAAQYSFKSIISVLSLPQTIAFSAIATRYFKRASDGKNLFYDDIRAEPNKEQAFGRFSEYLWLSGSETNLSGEICDFLGSISTQCGVEVASKRLLEQSLVSIWSTIEVLFRDTVEMYLNENPDRVGQLLKSEDAKRILGSTRKFTIEELAYYDFNISKQLGTFLIENIDFSKLANIRSCVPPIFEPCSDLIQQLCQKDLWLLNQRRHLFVHRAGIVDKEYIGKTSDTVTIGEPLTISPDMVTGHISTAVNLTNTLFGALSSIIR